MPTVSSNNFSRSYSTASEVDLAQEEHTTCCKCGRCINHCWFFAACCCFVFVSSLARLLVVIDGVFTVLLYLWPVRGSAGLDLTPWDWLSLDARTFAFTTSVFDVMVLAVLRCITLFWVYAYRFQLRPCSIMAATTTASVCTLYLVVKMLLYHLDAPGQGFLAYSVVMVLVEFMVFLAIRRKKIVGPTRRSQAYESIPETRVRMERPEASPQAGYQTLLDVEVDSPVKEPVMPDPVPHPSLNSASTVEANTLAHMDSQFVDIDGLQVHFKQYTASGAQPTGVPVILLHGFGGSLFNFSRCAHALVASEEVSTVIAFDRPGFGLTSRPLPAYEGSVGPYLVRDAQGVEVARVQDSPYTVAYSQRLLLKLMNYLELSKAVLVGHSTGGALALQACIEHPDRFLGCVCVSPTVYSEGFPDLVRSLFRTRLGKAMVIQLVRSDMGEVAIRRAWHHPAQIPGAVMADHKAIMRVRDWNGAMAEMAGMIDNNKLSKSLQNHRLPTLLFHGAQDKLVPFHDSLKLASVLEANLTKVTLIKIDECGHVPHEEMPAEFVAQIQTFLRDIHQPEADADAV